MADKKKKKKKDDLDRETIFANMNVEGFRWYHPEKKEGEELPPLTKEESRAMMRGAISALLPLLVGILVVMLLLVGIAYLWLA